MTDLQLYTELIALPADLKKEVEGFITSLKAKAQKRSAARQRQFGGAAGFFKMHDDFDEPLDDFKEYM